MTQLINETYAVIVPKDAQGILKFYNELSEPSIDYVLPTDGEYDYNDIAFPFDFTILGTVTSESIDFDVSGIVASKHFCGGSGYIVYMDYMTCEFDYEVEEYSFRSLLKYKKVEIGENEKLVIIQKR